jgi:hypothetical protein
MATDKYNAIGEGGISAAVYISLIADEAVTLWSPVIMVANPAITNGLPRVEPINTANSPGVIGIAVGGSGPIESGTAASAAGKVVQVQIYGLSKVRVNGNLNIAIGDNLITSAVDGVAQKVTAYPATYSSADLARYVFAKAMQASTVNLDIIACFLTGGGQ